MVRLDQPAQDVLRLTAAAGREVAHPLLLATARLPEDELRNSLRQAVGQGVLVSEAETGKFRFRHALLAEAVYSTILAGEREELHARLAEELARTGTASPAELAPHWAAAGRSRDALTASVAAAREAEAVFGLAEAHAHLERALALWPAVPDAEELTGVDLAEICASAARLAGQVAAAPRAVELARQAIELVGTADPHRAGLLHVLLGEYLYGVGSRDAALAALRRAVELVPEDPPSPERAYALGSLAGGLMTAQRFAESLPICEEALTLAQSLDARQAMVRALTVLGCDLAYLGRGDDGLARLGEALHLAEEIGDLVGLERAYVNLTDALTMLARPVEAERVGRTGLEVIRRYGIYSNLLVSNHVESLIVTGDWEEAETLSASALRALDADHSYQPLLLRADLEIGRGDYETATTRLDAAAPTVRDTSSEPTTTGSSATSRRQSAAGRTQTSRPERAWRGRAPATPRRSAPGSAPRRCAPRRSSPRSPVPAATPGRFGTGWTWRGSRSRSRAAAAAEPLRDPEHRRLARPGRGRVRARWGCRPAGAVVGAAATWDELERPAVAAYCRWREAEALVAVGASRPEAGAPAPRGARCRGPARRGLASRGRAARPTRPARSRAAGARASRSPAGSGRGSGPDAAGSRGPDLGRSWLHEP